MTGTLNSTIEAIFDDVNSGDYRSSGNDNTTTARKFMEIPIDREVFEMPVFAFSAFEDMLRKDYPGTVLVASLYSCGQMSSYKTLDNILKDVLMVNFNQHLQKIIVPKSENLYYATWGTIFDKDFKPLMMLSWLLKRSIDAFGRRRIECIRPILRLDALSFTAKEDALQRFLSGKFLSTSLGMSIRQPYFSTCVNFKQEHDFLKRPSFPIKVEIDRCPFCIKETEVPSISTTNESLLALADAHINDIMI